MLKTEVGVRGIAVLVFVLPVILSVVFGSFVMAEVLKEPDRELNMWRINISGESIISGEKINISLLKNQYSTTTPVEVEISLATAAFECGDIYITIYDLSIQPKQVVTQSGYFEQCYEKENSSLPVNDKFSEVIDKAGNYELVIEINDKNYEKTITKTEKFTVS